MSYKEEDKKVTTIEDLKEILGDVPVIKASDILKDLEEMRAQARGLGYD